MHRATPPLCLGAPQGVAEGVAGGVADSCGHLPGACPPWGHFSLTPEGRPLVSPFRWAVISNTPQCVHVFYYLRAPGVRDESGVFLLAQRASFGPASLASRCSGSD